MTEQERVWVIDDDQSIRWVLEKALEKANMDVKSFPSASGILNTLERSRPDVLITDVRMPGMDGFSLLGEIQARYPDLPVIVITAHSDLDSAVSAYRGGAFEYLPKPFDVDEAVELTRRAVEHSRSSKTGAAERTASAVPEIIGEAPAMQEVFRAIGRLSRSNITVLINGESGTGKELVARALHRHSPRADQPFVALNMAAIPRDLLESELFGHERGAFTGAQTQRVGRFEQADGGTLFLDEIGDMPLELQAKLLRVLQEKEITRTGGNTTIQVNTRIVAATNQDLKEKVRNKKFREDLYYRLNVVPLELPPLRERQEDIPDLVDYFLAKAAEEYGTSANGLTKEAMDMLRSYDWPGNVRELENIIQRAALLSPDAMLNAADFPGLISGQGGSANNASLEGLINQKLQSSLSQIDLQEMDNLYEMVLHQMERPLINIVLEKTRGNQVKAAEVLGINRNTLRKKIQALNITAKRN